MPEGSFEMRMLKMSLRQDGAGRQVVTRSGYTLTTGTDGKTAITCLTCLMTSHHPRDVAEKYCGHCHVFHEG